MVVGEEKHEELGKRGRFAAKRPNRALMTGLGCYRLPALARANGAVR